MVKKNIVKVGEKYGQWEVIGASEKPYYTQCRCKCGTVRDITTSSLIRGISSSCGKYTCNGRDFLGTEKSSENALIRAREKYLNKTINGLKIIDVFRKRGERGLCFKCVCSCEKIFETAKSRVLSGNTKTCGHPQVDCLQIGKDLISATSVRGSNALSVSTRIKGIVNKNSSTNINGVSQCKNGKYRAYIYFQRKQYHLGSFDKIEDAKKARKIAEKEIYGNFLEWFAQEHPDYWNKIRKDN